LEQLRFRCREFFQLEILVGKRLHAHEPLEREPEPKATVIVRWK
jgi:hypothetical protein